jgi:hypothetical protein
LIPGSLVQVRKGEKPGEVIVEANSQRSSKDWVRTVMVGTDGGFVFAMLKQPITAEFNDRMVIHVPDFKALDPIWEKKRSFEDLVLLVMRELGKIQSAGTCPCAGIICGGQPHPPCAAGPLVCHAGDKPLFNTWAICTSASGRRPNEPAKAEHKDPLPY